MVVRVYYTNGIHEFRAHTLWFTGPGPAHAVKSKRLSRGRYAKRENREEWQGFKKSGAFVAPLFLCSVGSTVVFTTDSPVIN